MKQTLSHTGQVSLLSFHSRMQERWKWWSHFVIILGLSASYSATKTQGTYHHLFWSNCKNGMWKHYPVIKLLKENNKKRQCSTNFFMQPNNESRNHKELAWSLGLLPWRMYEWGNLYWSFCFYWETVGFICNFGSMNLFVILKVSFWN